MLHITKSERRHTVIFLVFYLFAAVMSILMQFTGHTTGLSSVLYCFFIIAWGASVFVRIVNQRIRRDVIAISFFLLGLFVVRICRYFLFVYSLKIDRYLWYLYYIPYIALPMLTLDAAACVGKGERMKTPAAVKVLWTVSILLVVGVISNDIHHFLLRFGNEEFDLRMKFCLLLGTYVKRCSNLMLIADKSADISTGELALSIRESFDYMAFLDIDCELKSGRAQRLPSGYIVAAYDLFEMTIESVLDSLHACFIQIMPSEHILMTIETDSICPDAGSFRVNSAGLRLTTFVEDDIQHITLSMGGGAGDE